MLDCYNYPECAFHLVTAKQATKKFSYVLIEHYVSVDAIFVLFKKESVALEKSDCAYSLNFNFVSKGKSSDNIHLQFIINTVFCSDSDLFRALSMDWKIARVTFLVHMYLYACEQACLSLSSKEEEPLFSFAVSQRNQHMWEE